MYEFSHNWSQSLLTTWGETLVSLCVIVPWRPNAPKSFHIDVDSQSSSHIDLTPHWQSKLGRRSSWKRRTCWVLMEPQISLRNGNPSDNVCPRCCSCAALIVCADIKIISFQSAAGTFIILQEWKKCFGKYCYTALNILLILQSQLYSSQE